MRGVLPRPSWRIARNSAARAGCHFRKEKGRSAWVRQADRLPDRQRDNFLSSLVTFMAGGTILESTSSTSATRNAGIAFLFNRWTHAFSFLFFFPAALIQLICGSGRGEEPSGESPPPDFRSALVTPEFGKNRVRLSRQFAGKGESPIPVPEKPSAFRPHARFCAAITQSNSPRTRVSPFAVPRTQSPSHRHGRRNTFLRDARQQSSICSFSQLAF